MGNMKLAVVVVVLASLVGSSMQCVRFWGRTEETPCSSNPCLNGGICSDEGDGTFSCFCDEGFIGEHCETGSPCASNPCLNGGLCSDGGDGSYICFCEEGFIGEHCETEGEPECPNNMFFNYCASRCGPLTCGVTVDLCTSDCVEKCDCPPNMTLCYNAMFNATRPVDTCVNSCDECY